jgi:hypothetical protein
LACSDGSHVPHTGSASQGWVSADNIQAILSSGSAPTDGHPSVLSSYRAELSSLVVVLYMLYRITLHYAKEGKQATIFYDNKGALTNVLHKSPLGITSFFSSDYDLVEVAHELLSLVPSSIIGTGKQRESQHDLNDLANDLSTTHADRPSAFQTQVKGNKYIFSNFFNIT